MWTKYLHVFENNGLVFCLEGIRSLVSRQYGYEIPCPSSYAFLAFTLDRGTYCRPFHIV